MAAAVDPSARIRPSAWWYALVPLVLVIGFVLAVTTAIDAGRDIARSHRALGSDDQGAIPLEAGDEATVWAVWNDDRESEQLTRPDAQVAVTGPDGAPVAFERATAGTTTWSSGSEAGIDLGTFTAAGDGSYEVRVEWGSVEGGPQASVGVVDVFGTLVAVVRPVVASMGAAIAVWLVLVVLRGRAKRRRRREAASAQVQPSTSGGPIHFE